MTQGTAPRGTTALLLAASRAGLGNGRTRCPPEGHCVLYYIRRYIVDCVLHALYVGGMCVQHRSVQVHNHTSRRICTYVYPCFMLVGPARVRVRTGWRRRLLWAFPAGHSCSTPTPLLHHPCTTPAVALSTRRVLIRTMGVPAHILIATQHICGPSVGHPCTTPVRTPPHPLHRPCTAPVPPLQATAGHHGPFCGPGLYRNDRCVVWMQTIHLCQGCTAMT